MNNLAFVDICRTCRLQCSEGMVSLYDGMELNIYGRFILTLADVTIDSNDGMPSVICQKCYKLLKHAMHFKRTCERSYRHFEKILNRSEIIKNETALKGNDSTLSDYYVSSFSTVKHENISIRHNIKNEKIYDDCLMKNQKKTRDSFVDFIKFIATNGACCEKLKNLNKKSKSFKKNTAVEERIRKKSEELQRNLKNYRRTISETKHQRYIEIDGKYICKECEKPFSTVKSARSHYQRLHSGLVFTCEHCGESFQGRRVWKLHSTTHHDHDQRTRYVCDYCQYSAVHKYLLVEHIRLHTGERPYACDICSEKFRRKDILRMHRLRHSEKNYKCEHCASAFYYRGELTSHVNRVHRRKYLYQCYVTTCRVTYARPGTVRRHLLEVHGVTRDQQAGVPRILQHTFTTKTSPG